MIFQVDPYLERIEKHLASDDEEDLLYACLELRYSLEQIAYKKLQQRYKHIAPGVSLPWQPGRVVEKLMDLVDDRITEDATIRMAPESGDGSEPKRFITLGHVRGIDPKKLGKYWHKLGNFLHVQMPTDKNEQPARQDTTSLRAFIVEVRDYIKKVTETQFDAHFMRSVTFDCTECESKLIENASRLNDGDVIRCGNQKCRAAYFVRVASDGCRIQPHTATMQCLGDNCQNETTFNIGSFLDLRRDEDKVIKCAHCGKAHRVCWRLNYQELDGN